MLEALDIHKRYATPHGDLAVLSGVRLVLAAGEAAAIMGPSGSGKSSLLYILGGLEPPSSGVVRVAGRSIFDMGREELADFRNAEIGFVFQDHCLLPQCSVLENVLVPTLVAPVKSSRERKEFLERARALIDEVGLGSRIAHRPAELSGGEKQRVAIARALIRQPRLVLCDEPTGNLDPASADVVASLLLDLHRRHNSVLVAVTHSLRFAAHFPIRLELIGQTLRQYSTIT